MTLLEGKGGMTAAAREFGEFIANATRDIRRQKVVHCLFCEARPRQV
jgi:hypothetical protein